jgi:hypothetical protein
VVGACFSWHLAAVRYGKIYTGLAITNLRPLTHKSTTMVGNLKGRDHLEHLGIDGKIFIQMALMEMELGGYGLHSALIPPIYSNKCSEVHCFHDIVVWCVTSSMELSLEKSLPVSPNHYMF